MYFGYSFSAWSQCRVDCCEAHGSTVGNGGEEQGLFPQLNADLDTPITEEAAGFNALLRPRMQVLGSGLCCIFPMLTSSPGAFRSLTRVGADILSSFKEWFDFPRLDPSAFYRPPQGVQRMAGKAAAPVSTQSRKLLFRLGRKPAPAKRAGASSSDLGEADVWRV